jgi:hypothetical protein
MNFENYLSFKKAFRIAMPCLALSLFVASCSNEEATGTSNETTSRATNLTLTATAPVAKQSLSTRVGIKDDASDATNYVWLKDETLTLYWKNLHDDAHATIVYKVDAVMDGGKSCIMNPVDAPELANGFYKIHSLSPHTEFNFVDGELTATIDLGSQNQPNNAVDHDYMSDKMYQYATTVVQIHNGEIISGTTNLPFEFITSLMRVRVVNNTGLPIDVSKVKLSYETENNPQFYSKGIFTANEFIGAHEYVATADAVKNDLSVTTAKELANGAHFDVYMSFFPTAGYTQGATEQLNMVVKYDVNDIPGVLNIRYSVLDPRFQTGNSYLTFGGGDLYLLTLTITGDDLPDGAHSDPNSCESQGYEYTYNVIRDNINPSIVSGTDVFVKTADNPNWCIDGWEPISLDMFPTNASRKQLYADLPAEFRGYYDTSANRIYGGAVICVNRGADSIANIDSGGNWAGVSQANRLVRPICRRAIPMI